MAGRHSRFHAHYMPKHASWLNQVELFGDQFQYGGPHLCAGWKFPTPDGKAHFSVVQPPNLAQPDGTFRVATRRGKQFNSMVLEQVDPSNQAVREAVLISRADAERLGLANGDPVVLHSDAGEYRGRVHIAPAAPGSLQVHWLEGQVLIDRRRRSRRRASPTSTPSAPCRRRTRPSRPRRRAAEG